MNYFPTKKKNLVVDSSRSQIEQFLRKRLRLLPAGGDSDCEGLCGGEGPDGPDVHPHAPHHDEHEVSVCVVVARACVVGPADVE